MKKSIILILLLSIAAICLMLPGSAGADLTPIPITPGTDATTDITLAGDVAVFSFTPESTGYYIFESLAENGDPFGYLFDDEMEQITANDDYNNLNFRIREKLEGNTTYLFGARYLSEYTTGSFPVRLTREDGLIIRNMRPLIETEAGQAGSITVDAFSTAGGLTYQWYQVNNGQATALTGETGAEYAYPALTGQEKRNYRCTVADAAGRSESIDFTVAVSTHMTVEFPYSDEFLPIGTTKTYTAQITADYGEVTCLWEKWDYIDESTGWGYHAVSSTNSLTVENVQEGRSYQLTVTDCNGKEVRKSLWMTVQHEGFSLTPVGETERTVEAGTPITLEVTPNFPEGETGFTYSYHWSFEPYSGEWIDFDETGTSLTVTPREDGDYRCTIEDGLGNGNSVWFTVNVVSDMNAEADGESDLTVTPGTEATLKVKATSTAGGMTYQWYEYSSAFGRYVPIRGANGDAYTKTASKSVEYRCRVTDSNGCHAEVYFHVSIENNFSAWTESDTEVYLAGGEEHTFEVGASCTDGQLKFRWYTEDEYNGLTLIPEATDNSLTVTGDGEERQYRCSVTDKYKNEAVFTFYVYPPVPEIEAAGPDLYIKQSAGYTIQITTEETVTEDPAEWSLEVIKSDRYENVYEAGSHTGDPFSKTIVIPDNVLQDGERYYADLIIRYAGYGRWRRRISFVAVDNANPTMTLTMTRTNGSTPEEYMTGETYYLTVTGDSSVTALRVWKNNTWNYVRGNTITFSNQYPEGTYGFVAYGTKDTPGTNPGWYGTAKWTEVSNSLEINVTSKGDLARPTVTTDKTGSYSRGEIVRITVGKVLNATNYNVQINKAGQSGPGSSVFYGSATAGGEGEGTLTFNLPTSHLESGTYNITAYANATGYTEGASFTRVLEIAGTAPEEAQILIFPEEEGEEGLWTGERMTIYAYDPDYSDLYLQIARADGMESEGGSGGDHYILRSGLTYRAGDYHVTLRENGPDGAVLKTADFTIQTKGTLEPVTFTDAENIHAKGTAYTFGINKAANATKYTVYLSDNHSPNNYYTAILHTDENDPAETIPVTIPAESFGDAEELHLQVTAEAERWSPSYTYLNILVIDPDAEQNPEVQIRAELTENGETSERNEWYTTEPVFIRVTATNAEEVRLWNGRSWQTVTLDNGEWTTGNYYSEGNYAILAQGRSAGSETWDATSSIRTFTVQRRVAPAPGEYTHNVTDGKVNRGDVIRITPGEDPIFPDGTYHSDISYSAEIYAADGRYIGSWYERSGEILIPTDNLAAGDYKIKLFLNANGWERGESGQTTEFTVSEPATAPASFRVSKTEAILDEEIEIVYYKPGANRTGVKIQKDGYFYGETYDWREAGAWHQTFRETGTYTLTPYAESEAEGYTTGEPITITVISLGELEKVAPADDFPGYAKKNENLSISFRKVSKAEKYRFELYSYNSGEALYTTETTGGEGDTIRLEIDKQYFTEEEYLRLDIRAEASGYEHSYNDLYFPVIRLSSGASSTALQTIDRDGTATDRTEWYTGESVVFRVEAEATELRFWNGSMWDTYPVENGVWEHSCSYSEGDRVFFAQTRNGSGEWNTVSNAVSLHFTRRVLDAPSFTHNLTDGTIARGEILRITIGDDPDTGENTAPNDFNYYADVYRITTDANQNETREWINSYWMDRHTREIGIPTDNLTAGSYVTSITVDTYAWESGRTELRFTTTGSGEETGKFRISKADLLIYETAEIVAYVPEAYRIEVVSRREDATYENQIASTYNGIGYWRWEPGDAGTFILTARAYDENGTEIPNDGSLEPITVTVTSRGPLEPIQFIQGLPGILETGEPAEIQIAAVPNAKEYGFYFYYRENDGSSSEHLWTEEILQPKADAETISVTIPGEKLNREGIYNMSIVARVPGYDQCYEYLETRAFASGAQILRLPEGLTRIEDNAFEGGAFQAVIIPEGCVYVGEDAFKNCRNLIYVYCENPNMPLSYDVFDGCPESLRVNWRR